LIDCVYFAVVTATTIGYGDLVPSTDRGRTFTIVFGFIGVGCVMFALQEVGFWMNKIKCKYTALAGKLLLQRTKRAAQDVQDRNDSNQMAREAGYFCMSMINAVNRLEKCAQNIDAWLEGTIGPVYLQVRWAVMIAVKLVGPIGAYLAVGAFLGIFEGWTFAESFYFASMTVLTIGYGDLTPTTQAGRLFCIFYIPMALGVLCATYKVVSELRETVDMNSLLRAPRKLLEKLGGIETNSQRHGRSFRVSEIEFLTNQLEASGVESDLIELFREQFSVMDRNGKGYLDQQDIERGLEFNFGNTDDATTTTTRTSVATSPSISATKGKVVL